MYKIEKTTESHYLVSALDGSKLNECMNSVLIPKYVIDDPINDMLQKASEAMKQQLNTLDKS